MKSMPITFNELEKLKFIFTKRTGGARGRFKDSLLD
jgi:hypothetical protein